MQPYPNLLTLDVDSEKRWTTQSLSPQKDLKGITTHGDTRIDPWFWLRDVDDPETLEYFRAENAYTEAVMAPEEALQERLYHEMRSRIKEDDSTVPEKEGDYYYYTRFEEGKQYPVHCRKHLTLERLKRC
ncbi:MAG: hypothetical protein CM1200mP27_10750 [Chloroflexota bacterium]|nr:MAG: hypothetical protein CM1200mP27_10750 [Chloroflexota bacterium]